MKKYRILFFYSIMLAMTLIVARTWREQSKQTDTPQAVALDSFLPDAKTVKAELKKTGKSHRRFRELYKKVNIAALTLPKTNTNARFLKGLEQQLTLLKKAADDTYGDLTVNAEDLRDVVDIIRHAKSNEDIFASLDAYQICGNGSGDVTFTGYYSPVIRASKYQSAMYKYPVSLNLPDKKSESLHIVYLKDGADKDLINKEGTAILQLTDGTRHFVAFNGDYNRVKVDEGENHDLTDNNLTSEPQKMLVTYNVYQNTSGEQIRPVGAAKVPLTADYSVAVDKNIIPLGSVLLAEVPIMNDKGQIIRHEYRFLLAQDTGSAIKGAKIDLYMGEGDKAKDKMDTMKAPGRVWLLLPHKEEKKLVAQNL
jgi:membrane-bound lytic murein transglycosylase A